jgi:membrane dipeptidase
MLVPGWVRGRHDNQPATLKDVTDHIDHICQLAGNAEHAAIGSDLDGGFGREQSPSDLDTIADLQKLGEILAKRGYRMEDISLIMHGNWLRLLRRAWG